MDVLHELLQIKDIVEGPAKYGAGEGESHGVEGAVQDDPVHPVALGLADRRGVRGDPRSHGVAVDDQPGDGREEVGVCLCVRASACSCVCASVCICLCVFVCVWEGFYLAWSPTLSLTSRIAATAS